MPFKLAENVLSGNRSAVARLITHVENNHPDIQPALATLYPHTGKAHLVGITGSPGTGKSSLGNELTKAFRRRGKTVAVLAIDPTSPFSGGAILGDRIRMRELAGDPGVFIRSMASRGSLGGLAQAAHNAITIFDAAGFDVILIETVGAGQSEVEIARAAHTVIVVEAPGLGDDIQAIKAGILEIADIFSVNKADRPGASKTVSALKAMLELGHPSAHQLMHHGRFLPVADPPPAEETISSWQIPVIETVAVKGEGINQLIEAIEAHREHLITSNEMTIRTRARLTDELESQLQTELMARLLAQLPPDTLSETITKLVNKTISPYNAVQCILEEFSF